MSEERKKSKKSKKNKQEKEENPSENTNLETPKSKKRTSKDDSNEVTEKKTVKFTEETIDNEVEGDPSPKKKRKSKSQPISEEELAPLSEELEAEINKPENIKNVASKRQQKREKYEKLKADKKMEIETKMQQKGLNYLSQWKHNRKEWKFEKIKQIWLQTHLFDNSRIPDEFWETTLLYFGDSKGRIRKVLIDECMKIVDEADKNDDEETEKETSEIDETKFKRAREMLQHLQE